MTNLPNCPKCGGQATAPIRQGMSLPYRCTACGQSFQLVFAMSDIGQLKEAYAGEAEATLTNCNIKIVHHPK